MGKEWMGGCALVSSGDLGDKHRMKKIRLLLCLSVLVPPFVFAQTQTAQSFSKEIKRTVSLQYLLDLPEGYEADPDKKWPLMLFLHGSGERGTDIARVKVHGPPKIAGEKKLPFVVVSPQCPPDQWWDVQALTALLDEVERNLRIDSKRIYVTGLSMGGFGTWSLVAHTPDRFAAIAPICGGGEPKSVKRFTHVPVWVFHGDQDGAVKLRRSEDMVAELRKKGADVTFTVYPGVGHDSWTETYNNPALYTWLLSHSLK